MSVTLTSVPRKTLAEQLDRFDSILDGLADAIPETIDEAVRQASPTSPATPSAARSPKS